MHDERRLQKGFLDKISITPLTKRRLKETYFLCEYLPYCHNIVAPQPEGWQRGAEKVSSLEASKIKFEKYLFYPKICSLPYFFVKMHKKLPDIAPKLFEKNT